MDLRISSRVGAVSLFISYEIALFCQDQFLYCPFCICNRGKYLMAVENRPKVLAILDTLKAIRRFRKKLNYY